MLQLIKNNKHIVIYLFIIVVTTGYIFYSQQNNNRLQQEIVELEKAVQATALKTGSKDNVSREKPPQSVKGYNAWMKAKKIADHFYKVSDGEFKKEWGMFLAIEALRRGMNPQIVFGVLKIETGGTFDPKTVGPKTKYGRAYGMAQFMENTAPWIAEMAGLAYDKDKLFNPYYSIQLSVVYLDFLHDRYGNWNKALTAYNRGIYGMKDYIDEYGHSKSNYAMTVKRNASVRNMSFSTN